MPADERFWRNLRTMHVVFALSAGALLVATVLMMYQDHNDEWRVYQRTWDRVEAAKLRAQAGSMKSDEYQARVESLREQAAAADEAIDKDEVRRLESEINDLKLQAELATQKVRGQRAVRDKARADFDLSVAQARPTSSQRELEEAFQQEQREVERLELILQEREIALNAQQQELQKLTAERDLLQTELAAAQSDVQRLETARAAIEPDSRFSRIKRTVMQWPIIDGFNSPHKIQMDWLPDHKITLGMAKTARFDRCRTCHLAIDRVETGNIPAFPHGHPASDDVEDWVAKNEFPHPFATHPNPALYLTPSSPHPLPTFGCTICHEGQGSGTDFANAAHTPNDPHIDHEWAHEHNYASNHFWEYPMLPKRFQESTCLKCHHDVTELGVNEKWGATAPKVHQGFQTIEKFGCFGCHEVHGFDGDRRIGPDLRLEPNYWAVAEQLLSDPAIPDDPDSEEAATATTAMAEMSRLARAVAERPFETKAERQRLRQLVLADAKLEQPRLTMQSRNLADELKDLDHPGQHRKVGPSLRHIAEKTYRGWIEYWTEDPQRFRPTTNMPRFFHLANQEDPHAALLQPVELAGIAEYLLAKSQPLNLMRPEQGYEPDAERGKLLFSRRGCLACHSHGEFKEIDSDFGPQLDRVHEKILPGEQGFNWLYTWIRNPHLHSPRSRMPNLFLEPYEEGGRTVDPAADIAAWLLKGKEGGEKKFEPIDLGPYLGVAVDEDFTTDEARRFGLDAPRGARVTQVMANGPATRVTPVTQGEQGARGSERLQENDIILSIGGQSVAGADALGEWLSGQKVGREVPIKVRREGGEREFAIVVDEPLNDLVRLYLSKILKNPQVEETFTARNYPIDPGLIKGDEIELSRAAAEDASEDEWRSMKLRYVGRRTISRYGCYGCHDVPGFEAARPIGTPLQDWGRKDPAKLALEHIEEYLHHHGEANGDSTRERVIGSMKDVQSERFQNQQTKLNQALAERTRLREDIEALMKVTDADEFAAKRRRVQESHRKLLAADEDLRALRSALDESSEAKAADPSGLSAGYAALRAEIEKTQDAVTAIEDRRDSAMSAAFFYESLLHHGRPGFIWQKLREPRSYDYLKTDTKGYDERLRMPKFPFDEEQIENVATFVLGLVAEPPASQYVYSPDDRARTRIAGEHLLEKYNCASCHMLDTPKVSYGLPVQLPPTEGLADGASFTNELDKLVTWLAEHPEAVRGGKLDTTKYAKENPETLQSIEADVAVLAKLGFDVDELGRISRPGVPMERRRRDLAEWFSVRAYVGGMTRSDVADWLADNAGELRQGTGDVATYPPTVQRMISLGANLDEIAQLTWNKDPQVTRANVRQWLDDHPEVLLVGDLQNDEFLAGVRQLMKLKPPVGGDTDRDKDGAPVIRFDGLLKAAPDPEEPDPEFRLYSFSLFKTLSVAGRVFVPGTTMSFSEPALAAIEPSTGGRFAHYLVDQLASDPDHKANANRSKAWEASPPPLYAEGHKVQTGWLYRFLKNPDRIRHETVLRMPRFNMSDDEARTLANYFAAADGAEYPYDEIPQREEEYLTSVGRSLQALDKQAEDEAYLPTAWQVLTRNDLCIGCHSVGGREFRAGDDPAKVTHGPDLQRVPDRLRPEYLQLWLYKPAWVLPYTSMPAPGSKPVPGLFESDPQVQVVALRDALMNYHRMMESEMRTLGPPGPIPSAGQQPAAGEGQPQTGGGTADETGKDNGTEQAPPGESGTGGTNTTGGSQQ